MQMWKWMRTRQTIKWPEARLWRSRKKQITDIITRHCRQRITVSQPEAVQKCVPWHLKIMNCQSRLSWQNTSRMSRSWYTVLLWHRSQWWERERHSLSTRPEQHSLSLIIHITWTSTGIPTSSRKVTRMCQVSRNTWKINRCGSHFPQKWMIHIMM